MNYVWWCELNFPSSLDEKFIDGSQFGDNLIIFQTEP